MPSHDELLAPLGVIGEGFAAATPEARAAAWEAGLTEDAVWEAPFTDPPIAVVGRVAVLGFFEWLATNVPNFQMNMENVHFIEASDSYIIQVSGGGPTIDGDVYEQRYFSLIQTRDGRISYFREHFKVQETYRAFGRDRFHDDIAEIQRKADAAA